MEGKGGGGVTASQGGEADKEEEEGSGEEKKIDMQLPYRVALCRGTREAGRVKSGFPKAQHPPLPFAFLSHESFAAPLICNPPSSALWKWP